jgi:hypothetical protein
MGASGRGAARGGGASVVELPDIPKHRQSFPNDEAATKLVFMGLKNISRKWTMDLFKNPVGSLTSLSKNADF